MLNLLKHRGWVGGQRRPKGMTRRLGSALLTVLRAGVLVTATTAAASAAVARVSRTVSPSQQLAVLDYEHRAYRFPRTSAPLTASVPAHRPNTSEQTTLPV